MKSLYLLLSTCLTGTRLSGFCPSFLLLAIASLSLSGQVEINLIQKGGFDDLNGPNQPADWNVNAFNPQSIEFPNNGGNVVCLFDQDPNGQNFNNPVRLIDQFMPGFPLENPPSEVFFSGQVARPPGTPATLGSIRFEIHFFTNSSFIIVEIVIDPANIPDDGQLHPFQGSLQFPPNFFTENNFNQAYFAITKVENGPIIVDDLFLSPGGAPRTFEVFPGSGPLIGGTEVTVIGSGPITEPFLHVNGRGAHISDRQERQITFHTPPGNQPGPVDIQLFTEDGQETVIQNGFTYYPPLVVHTVRPQTISQNPETSLEFKGTGFQPDTEFRVGGVLIPPENATIETEIVQLDLVSVSPIDVGFATVEATNPDGQTVMAPHPIQIVRGPMITSIKPAFGHLSGGSAVKIQGVGFSDGLLPVQAICYFGGQPLVDTQVLSDTMIQGFTPPGPPGPVDVTVSVANGVQTTAHDAFEFMNQIPGDYDGNGVLTTSDAVHFQRGLFNDSLGPNDPGADVNGDGILDLLDAHTALQRAANPDNFQNPWIAEPELHFPQFLAPAGCPIDARVRNLGGFAPAGIDWGDGFHSNVAEDGVVTHTYDNPGTYMVTMKTEHTTTEPQTVTIPSMNPVHVEMVELSMTGMDIDNNPIGGRTAQLNPVNDPPELSVDLTASGSGKIFGTLKLDSSLDNADLYIPFIAEVPADPVGEKLVQVNLGTIPMNPGELHVASVEITHGADLEPEATAPMPVTVQIPDFVTTGDCEELERQWKALVIAKEAKKVDCEALQKQLDQLKKDLAKKEADKPVKEQDLQDAKDQRDSIEGDLQNRIDAMNAFLGPNANVQTYENGDSFPPGDNHVGAKRNGSSTGVGMSFGSGSQALDGISNYEGATNRDFGADMAEMRQMIKDLENLDESIQNQEQDLNKLNGEIDDLKNTKIPEKEQELADCKAMCVTLEGQIEALVTANEECLKQLEEQRQAAAGIRTAERQGGQTQNQSDRTDGNADNAENLVDGRGGSPEQVANDESEVATAKACQEQAQDLIDDGNGLLRLAKAALAAGNTESANDLRMQAQAKFDAAKAKLDEAQEHINTANSNARSRKRRDCPKECEGLDRITEETYKVFTHVTDVTMVLLGYTPESWASFNENVKEAIDGLALVSDIAEAGGDYSPIGSAFTPDVKRAATAIVGFYTRYAARLGLDVWIKHRGHCAVKRTTYRCVNGCWELIGVEWERIGEDFEESTKIGSIPAGTPKNAREGVVQQLLNKYNSTRRVIRKSPPTTSKAQ